jgi:lambda family phage portal protein
LDEYEDAQLVRQKIAACFSAFVQSTGEAPLARNDTPQHERLEPGIIQYLERGETVSFAAPPGAEGYGEYTKKVLQAIAAGYGITYEAMTGDLANVNFSSGRMGWLEFQRNISDLQFGMVIPQLCLPGFQWFIDSAKLAGKIASTFTAPVVNWTPARREMIDPLKETQAIKEAILIGIQPWQEAVREQGYSPEQVLQMLKDDQDNFDRLGLKLTSDPRNSSALQGQNQATSTPPAGE